MRYLIVPNNSLYKSKLFVSVDETEAVIKSNEGYSHDEMLEILLTPHWTLEEIDLRLIENISLKLTN